MAVVQRGCRYIAPRTRATGRSSGQRSLGDGMTINSIRLGAAAFLVLALILPVTLGAAVDPAAATHEDPTETDDPTEPEPSPSEMETEPDPEPEPEPSPSETETEKECDWDTDHENGNYSDEECWQWVTLEDC